MTESQINSIVYKNLDKFTDLWDKKGIVHENPMPENIPLTVYCQGIGVSGFVYNTTKDELGLDELIASKWILHSELENIVGFKIES